MEKKYRLLDNDTIRVWGETLYRIEALKDFAAVKKGEKGGFIEKEDNLSHEGNCWVSDDARVSGNARVYDDAWVCDKSWVSGNAQVYGNALMRNESWAYGSARVYGNAFMRNKSWVYGNAQVCGNALVCGYARVSVGRHTSGVINK